MCSVSAARKPRMRRKFLKVESSFNETEIPVITVTSAPLATPASEDESEITVTPSGLPFGSQSNLTTAFMAGTCYVKVVLLESSENSENIYDWLPEQIESVKNQTALATYWWEEMYAKQGYLGNLEFVLDFEKADNPYVIDYEPTEHTSNTYTWFQNYFNSQGASGNFITAGTKYANTLRETNGTDWAFTLFVANGSLFDGGGSGYAFLGGPFLNVTYSNGGYGISRLKEVIAHEMGHIFNAEDEYAGSGGSYNSVSGYYGTQNTNAANDRPESAGAQEASIMLAMREPFANLTSPASTLAQLGWQDTDGDGIIDVLDVAFSETVTADNNKYDKASNTYTVGGDFKVGAMKAAASFSGNAAITTNTIDYVQYRFDSGAWVNLNEEAWGVHSKQLEPVTFTVAAGTRLLEWRVVDADFAVLDKLGNDTDVSVIYSYDAFTWPDLSFAAAPAMQDGKEVELAPLTVAFEKTDAFYSPDTAYVNTGVNASGAIVNLVSAPWIADGTEVTVADEPRVDDELYLNFSIYNGGDDASGDFVVSCFLNGVFYKDLTLSSMAPDSYYTVTNLDIGTAITERGLVKFDIVADANEIVLDSSRVNNSLTGEIYVYGDAPEFTADNLLVDIDDYSATVTWDAASEESGITGYYVVLDGKAYNAGETAEYTFSKLEVGKHNVTVRAYNEYGDRSVAETPVEFKITDNIPPVIFTSEPTWVLDEDKCVITWRAATDENKLAGYVVTVDGVSSDAGNTLSYTVLYPTVGTHEYTITAYDLSNNRATSAVYTFTVPDITAPVLGGELGLTVSASGADVECTWAAASDDVAVAGYYVYSRYETPLSSVEHNYTVSDGSALGFTFADAAPGKYTVSYAAFDAAGNVTPRSAEKSVMIFDTVAPVLPETVRAASVDYYVTLSWDAATDNVGTAGYKIKTGDTVTDLGNVLSYSFANQFEAGVFTVSLAAYDAAGNESDFKEYSFTVADVTPPAFASGALVSVTEQDGKLTLNWSAASDNVLVSTYKVTIGAETYDAGKNLTFVSPALAFGTYSCVVTAYDAAGNASAPLTSQEIVVPDHIAPVLGTGSMSQILGYNAKLLWDAASDNSGVAGYKLMLDNVEYDLGNVLQYTFENIAPGVHYWNITAYDTAGNVADWLGERSFTVDVDVTPPTVPLELEHVITGSAAVLSWGASTDMNKVGYEVKIQKGAETPALQTVSELSVPLTLADGDYIWSVRAFDIAGNYSDWSEELSFRVDVTAPTQVQTVTFTQDKAVSYFSWSASTDNLDAVHYTLVVVNSRTGATTHYETDGTSLEFTDFDYGASSCYVIAGDSSNNKSLSETINFEVVNYVPDTLPPVFGEVSCGVSGSTVSIEWKDTADNVGVDGYSLVVNGVTYNYTAAETLFTGKFADGDYQYTLYAYDEAGNTAVTDGAFSVRAVYISSMGVLGFKG